MGYFGKPRSTSVTLDALSKDRVRAAIEARGWSYEVDSDGDIGAGWASGVFWFFPVGDEREILQIRGTWRGRLSAAQLPRACEVLNTWHMETLWPKAYARCADDDVVSIHTEVSVDWEHGVSDHQLSQQLSCALSTSHELFERLAAEFPEAAPPAGEE